VAVNALIGLHLSGAVDATASLKKMAGGKDPMGRAAAAFAMGRILKDEFKPVLETLLRDANPNVRGRALAALIQIRRHQQEAAKNAASPSTEPAPEEAPPDDAGTEPETPESPSAPNLPAN
jgi:HEAT repeats